MAMLGGSCSKCCTKDGLKCYVPANTHGACCKLDGTCSIVAECDCDTESGEVFKGVGTACSPNPCLRCVLQQSGEIAGFSGSSVSFDDGGGSYRTLDYFGVSGYWLGRGAPGPTQSVTFSFSTAKPISAVVRVSGLDSGVSQERLNYRFVGASSVVFTPEVGIDFEDNGSSVTRAGSGDTRFRLEAQGEISEVFIEGEMVDGGSNGVVAEVCFSGCINCSPLP